MEDVTRFILNISEADSPNSRNARGLRWNHLKQRRNCGANWTSFHCSAAWAVRTVHCLAHCPSTWNIGTENQLHWLQPLWWNAEKLLQLASLVTNNNKQWTIILCSHHCSPASAVGSDPPQHTAALQARCQGTVTRRHGPTLNSAICIDIRMARDREDTAERRVLHSTFTLTRRSAVSGLPGCSLLPRANWENNPPHFTWDDHKETGTTKSGGSELYFAIYLIFNCIATANPNARLN